MVNHSYGGVPRNVVALLAPPPPGLALSLATVWVFHLQPGRHLLDEGASGCLDVMLDLTGGSAATLTTGQVANRGGPKMGRGPTRRPVHLVLTSARCQDSAGGEVLPTRTRRSWRGK